MAKGRLAVVSRRTGRARVGGAARRPLVAVVVGAVALALLALAIVVLAPAGGGWWPRGSPGAAPAYPAAPEVTIATVGGGRFSLAEQRGTPVILFFMAGWCATCVPEARALARLHQEERDRGLQVLVVDVEASETEAELAGFQRLVPDAGYLWAIDRGYALTRAFGVRALDTTVIIDRQGRIAYRDEVPTTYAQLKQALAAVLP